MARRNRLENKLVVLVGGGGFLGRHTAEELLKRGARLRIADRHPEKAYYLRPLANLGQIQFARCNVKDTASLATAIGGADAVVYLPGTWGADGEAVHCQGAAAAARAALSQRAQAFIYISSIGADAFSESPYAASKGAGEAAVREAFPMATILRPSVLFGEDDAFINLFARPIASLPAVPVFGARALLQPLFVDDAALAVAESLSDPERHGGMTYVLGGPEVLTMAELNRRIARAQGRERVLLPVPDALCGLFAAFPGTPMTTDQWHMLQRGNVAAGALGCEALGIVPRPLGLFLERWMTRYRKHGRFGDTRDIVADHAFPSPGPREAIVPRDAAA